MDAAVSKFFQSEQRKPIILNDLRCVMLARGSFASYFFVLRVIGARGLEAVNQSITVAAASCQNGSEIEAVSS
jgi:hypothetical protein